jgi:Superinfection immunity protein
MKNRIIGFLIGGVLVVVVPLVVGRITSADVGDMLRSFFGVTLGAVPGLVVLLLILVFYFLPAMISSKRKTKHGGMIFFINLVFGWTVLGWIAALIWAIVESPEEIRTARTASS